jgi:hypothetical protein
MRATFVPRPALAVAPVVADEPLEVRAPGAPGRLAVWVKDEPRPYRAALDEVEVQEYLFRWAVLAEAGRGVLVIRD